MTPKLILALILTTAVLAAWVRLALWRRGAPASPLWRFVLLLGLQPVWAALLFFGLFPPALPVAGGALTVLTANAPRTAGASGGQAVALPEADVPGMERVPDLGTALRLYPDVRRIRVLGDGLTARDRDALSATGGGLSVDFTAAAPRPGLISLTPPVRVAPGMRFQTGGQVAGLPGAVVDLVDPAGRVTDSQTVDAEGRFTVSGTARAAGLVTFGLRLKDSGGKVIEQADIPVRVESEARPRLLILAGAPGPEVKYLRRWATDAGFAVNTQMSAGGGIQLGDPAIALNAATLRQFDVAVIDDRSWPGARPAVLAAVRDGLGLVLRAGGPLDASTRSSWRSLGFALAGPDVLSPIALPPGTDAAIARTRSGIGSADAPSDADLGGEPVIPELSRLAAIPGGADAVPLIRDAAGTPLSAWRATGLGRVAVFTGIDSYGLTLTGHSALYGDWWSGMLATVARPSAGAPVITGPAWVGDRLSLCGLSPNARVQSPDGAVTTLIPDPGAGGCAGLWPAASGWHLLRTTGANNAEQVSAFYVQPAYRLPGVKGARDRDATMMLGRTPAASATTGEARTQPGPSWPWLLAWLLVGAALWWFERSNLGRAVSKTALSEA